MTLRETIGRCQEAYKRISRGRTPSSSGKNFSTRQKRRDTKWHYRQQYEKTIGTRTMSS